jgi:UDP-N-acetylmuramyl pentapeptide synthase
LESVLAAVAAAWALGIAHHVIRTGVQTFSPDSNANDGTHPTTPDPITPHSMPTHA